MGSLIIMFMVSSHWFRPVTAIFRSRTGCRCEGPHEVVERSGGVAHQIEGDPGVLARCDNLLAVANDVCVGHQTFDVVVRECGHGADLEVGECLAERGTALENGDPGEPRLERLKADLLK